MASSETFNRKYFNFSFYLTLLLSDVTGMQMGKGMGLCTEGDVDMDMDV